LYLTRKKATRWVAFCVSVVVGSGCDLIIPKRMCLENTGLRGRLLRHKEITTVVANEPEQLFVRDEYYSTDLPEFQTGLGDEVIQAADGNGKREDAFWRE
jgi:hypothetical protein